MFFFSFGYLDFLLLQHFTRCVMNLDKRGLMIILKSLLTTSEASIIFWRKLGSS